MTSFGSTDFVVRFLVRRSDLARAKAALVTNAAVEAASTMPPGDLGKTPYRDPGFRVARLSCATGLVQS